MKARGLSEEPYAFLRRVPLFAGVSESGLRALAKAGRIRCLTKGEPLFLQSDRADAVFLVFSGSIVIVLDSEDGRELVINEMCAGDCFGELALLTGQPRSTGATARVDSEVFVIPRQAFEPVLHAEPALAMRLLETVARRLSNSSERESALAFLDAQARLARLLLSLDQQAGDKGYVTISQEELAQRAGLTRQTVAKALSRWRRSGWLLTGRGKIVLLNLARLEGLGSQDEWASP